MTVHLLSTPKVLAKLRNELKEAIPNPDQPPPIKDIEQLPYLGAVISEGFRLAIGTSQRQTRINPDGDMVLIDGRKEWRIPSGVSLNPLIHLLPPFPDPPKPWQLLEPYGLTIMLDSGWHGCTVNPSQPRHLPGSHGISTRAFPGESPAAALHYDFLSRVQTMLGNATSNSRALPGSFGDLAEIW